MDAVTLALAKAYTNSQRIAYIEPGKVLIEHEIVSDEGLDFGLPLIDLVPGRKYTVTLFDGVESVSGEYEAMEIRIEEENYHVVYLGNPSIFGWEDNGELFLVASGKFGTEGEFGVVGALGGAIDNITVETTETIHPIDPKFLPGAVVLETDLSAATALSEADCTKLNDAVKAGLPITAKVSLMGGSVTTVLQMVKFPADDGSEVILLNTPKIPTLMVETIILAQEGDSWSVEFVTAT